MKKIFGLFVIITSFWALGQETIRFNNGQFLKKELPYAIPLTITGDLELENGLKSNLVILQVRSLGSINNQKLLEELAQLSDERKELRKELKLEGSATARLLELEKDDHSETEILMIKEVIETENQIRDIEAKLYSSLPEETFFKSKNAEVEEFELSLSPLLYDTKYEFNFHFFSNEEKPIEQRYYDTLNIRLYKKFSETGLFNSQDANEKLESLAQEIYTRLIQEKVDALGLKYVKIEDLVDEPKLIIPEGVDYGKVFIDWASMEAFFNRRVKSLSEAMSGLVEDEQDQKNEFRNKLDSLKTIIKEEIDSIQNRLSRIDSADQEINSLNELLTKLKGDSLSVVNKLDSLDKLKPTFPNEFIDQISELTIDNYTEKSPDLQIKFGESRIYDDLRDGFSELDELFRDYKETERESLKKLEQFRIEGAILQQSYSITTKTLSAKTDLDALPFRTDYGVAMTLNNEDPRIFRYIGVKIYLLENNDKSLSNKAAYNYEQFWTLRRLFVSVGFLTPGGLTFKGQSLDDIDDMEVKPTLAIGYDIRKEFAVNFGTVFAQQRFNLDGTAEDRVRMFPFVSLSFDFDLFNKIKNSNP